MSEAVIDILVAQQEWLRSLLDIVLVFLILRGLFNLMRGTKGMYFINGLIILFLIFAGSRYLKLTLFSQLLDQMMMMLMVALPIIFQSELKNGLEKLGQKNPILKWFQIKPVVAQASVNRVTEAAVSLAQNHIGAIIVFERETPLITVLKSGTVLDAVLSKVLVEQLFYKNSPLHDGAILIKENRIQAAGCFLPLDNELRLPQSLGSRHRAGLSLAMQTDALAVIVSEETGKISLACSGRLETGYNREQLQHRLEELLQPVQSNQVEAEVAISSEDGIKEIKD